MKKKWMVIAGTVAIFGAFASGAFAANPIRIIVNGQELKSNIPLKFIEGRTVAPVRLIAEALGAEVDWDGKNNTVIINGAKPAAATISIVGWNKITYSMSNEKLSLDKIGKQIGQSGTTNGLIRTGDKLYEINGLDPTDAIAIEQSTADNGKTYYKLTRLTINHH